jgi:serine/threonine protein kinase
MKFFGYTSKKPKLEEIEREIKLMQSLAGIPNVVQIEGIFQDSPEGYVPHRIYEDSFPVIVMEALLGGDLFDRLQAPGDQMTERFLSSAFRGVIEALHQIHLRGFIHRDLKLENMIYESKDSNSPIKVSRPLPSSSSELPQVVDFGMMKKIRSPQGIYVSLRVEGTAGYCAPESYLYRIYSGQSDLWQAGCCLYSMLSGNAAFPQDNPERVKAALYAPMTGVAWNCISEPAKDLIRKILVKDPLKRCTLEEILEHPWLQPGIAPERELDDGYRTRIYKLALRNRMKLLFLNEDLQKTCKVRRELLMNTLPFLRTHDNSSVPLEHLLSGEDHKGSPSLSINLPLPSPPASPSANQFIQQKLRYLKSGLFHAPSPLSPPTPLAHHGTSSFDIPPQRISSATLLSSPEEESIITEVPRRTSDSVIFRTRASSVSNSSWRNINLTQVTFQDFMVIMNKVDLPQLATLPVFHIFEKGSSGVMDMKEFLLTILTIYPHSSPLPPSPLLCS